MRRLLVLVMAGFFLSFIAVPAANAGSAHFIGNAFTISPSADTLSVSGKEAGLGDEAQIHVVLSATALCINGGNNHPKAVNKTSVNAAGDFPVQNGKAEFTLSVTAVFQPPCSPPMTVQFTSLVLTDTTNNLSVTLIP